MSKYGIIELHDSYDFSTQIAPREVVMCKDCKHRPDSEWLHCSYVTHMTSDDDFCSYGCRSEKPNNSKERSSE